MYCLCVRFKNKYFLMIIEELYVFVKRGKLSEKKIL